MESVDGPPTSKPPDDDHSLFKKTGEGGFAVAGVVSGFESNKKEPNSSRGNDHSVFSPVKPYPATFEIKKQNTDTKSGGRKDVSPGRSSHILCEEQAKGQVVRLPTVNIAND